MADLFRDWILDPTALLFLLSLALIWWLRRGQRRLSRGSGRSIVPIVTVWLAVFLVFSAPNIVNPLLAVLEDQYPEAIACDAGSHLVMLGGGVDSRIQSSSEFESMSLATLSRATAAARIAETEPVLRIVAAGGALKGISEADVVASYWVALGIADSRILRESQSSNTRENAINVAALLTAETVEGPVRLLTSALHMPRALRTFRQVFGEQGLAVCPVSVDREAIVDVPLWAFMPQTTALWKFDRFLHEIAALAIYRLRGWI